MKTTGRCVKCSSLEVYALEQNEMRIVGDPKAGDLGLQYKHAGKVPGVTPIDLWICGSCGYMEWYARDASQILRKLVELREKFGIDAARKVNPEPAPPYR